MKSEPMTRAQKCALDTFLSDYPKNKIFDDIIDDLKDSEDWNDENIYSTLPIIPYRLKHKNFFSPAYIGTQIEKLYLEIVLITNQEVYK